LPSRLYLITPPHFDIKATAHILPAVLDAADVACVQLRLKDASDDEWKRAIEALMPIAHQRDIAFILNDRTDLAHAMRCDGVHLGQEDTPYEPARDLLGRDKIIGISAYGSKHRAMYAASQGADYVAFGSVFPETSTVKPDAAPVALSVLEDWVATATTPCVAIGGINAENCAPLVRAGVDFIAVIGAVWNYADGPVAGVKALQEVIAAKI
jgi:thiamine-phosphate pyrophosphorylase